MGFGLLKYKWFVGVICTILLMLFYYFVFTETPKAFDGRYPYDFPQYYIAGLRILEHRPVYTELRDEISTRLGFAGYRAVYSSFISPDSPVAVILLSPLSLLPYRMAWFVFATGLLFAGAWANWVSARTGGLSELGSGLLVVLALNSVGFQVSWITNHMEWLVLIFIVAGWLLMRKGMMVGGGGLWGLAAAIKVFPIVFIFILLLSRRWQAAVAGLVSFLLLNILACWVLGWDDVVNYWKNIFVQSSQWYGACGNYSLLSVGYKWGIVWLRYLLPGLLMIWLVGLWRRDADVDVLWVVGTAAALLLSPLSWVGYLIMIYPVVAFLMGRYGGSVWLWLLVIGLYFCPGYFTTGWENVPVGWEQRALNCVPTLAMVGVFAFGYFLSGVQKEPSRP